MTCGRCCSRPREMQPRRIDQSVAQSRLTPVAQDPQACSRMSSACEKSVNAVWPTWRVSYQA